jgi:hypothetical protein
MSAAFSSSLCICKQLRTVHCVTIISCVHVGWVTVLICVPVYCISDYSCEQVFLQESAAMKPIPCQPPPPLSLSLYCVTIISCVHVCSITVLICVPLYCISDYSCEPVFLQESAAEIGRASCRERVSVKV